ncbi:MAG TPA: hypothetical protein VLM80_11705 [Anaerolineales bacterium]|nr:hypothetical protein [Anaerolineales bacterium]
MIIRKSTLRILLIVFVLMLITLACVGGVDSGNANLNLNGDNPSIQGTQAVSATATFGAAQFQIQLTAIAEKKAP